MINCIYQLDAQDEFKAGILPTLSLTTKVKSNWKINLKLESRNILREGVFEERSDFNYKNSLTDVALLASHKLGLFSSLGGGYLIRFKEGSVVHRFIQYYTFTKKINAIKLSHRLRTDQSFGSDRDTAVRLRYRIACIIPTNGMSVDSKEFFLKFTNEYLQEIEDKKYGFEARLASLLGYNFTDNNKLESGLDYRYGDVLERSQKHSFWLMINWYLSF